MLMLPTILFIILAILMLTTRYLVVSTIIFQWSYGSVEKIEGVQVNDEQVAEHLAAAVRCQTFPLDDTGTPDPESFQQLHQILAETNRGYTRS
jgi:hypothetical protein